MTGSSVRSFDSPTTEDVVLSDEQRSSLLDQLFAMHQREDPGCHLCFCGSDGDLVEAVTEMRGRLERELGDEEPELRRPRPIAVSAENFSPTGILFGGSAGLLW